MNSFDEFAERALAIIPDDEQVSYDDLERLFENEEQTLKATKDYVFSSYLYHQDQIEVEDGVMAIFGFDPDWRSPE